MNWKEIESLAGKDWKIDEFLDHGRRPMHKVENFLVQAQGCSPSVPEPILKGRFVWMMPKDPKNFSGIHLGFIPFSAYVAGDVQHGGTLIKGASGIEYLVPLDDLVLIAVGDQVVVKEFWRDSVKRVEEVITAKITGFSRNSTKVSCFNGTNEGMVSLEEICHIGILESEGLTSGVRPEVKESCSVFCPCGKLAIEGLGYCFKCLPEE